MTTDPVPAHSLNSSASCHASLWKSGICGYSAMELNTAAFERLSPKAESLSFEALAGHVLDATIRWSTVARESEYVR